ncbi:MAG TPA: IPT/TIG domain-containing protein [Kofleriaceae bacterium]|nr:IPT/TIG domain-containing protein [Kofleriaceae bacterium]
MFALLSSSCAALALLAAGCGDDDGGGGDGVTCGPGTHLEDGVCLPDGTDGDAPTVSAIEPASGLVGGGEPFTITGTGFASGGDVTVSFGDSVAGFEIVSDTEITGTTPRASAPAVTVTVETAFGSATADFQYRGLYGADGKGAVAGNLHLVDPRDGTSVVIGPIESDAGPHAVTGLAFDGDGTLWATDATAGLDEGPAPNPRLLTIDPATGAATVVGDLLEGATRHRSISAITFAGTTLLGWTRTDNAPVSIDTTSAAVTVLGPGLGRPSFGNGIVAMDEGTAIVFPAGAADGADNRGHFYSVNAADGALADIGVLGGTGSASVCGATFYRGALFALLCPHLADLSGSVLATVDPGDGSITNIAATAALGLDAIASDEPAAPAAGRFIAPAGSSSLLPDLDCAASIRVVERASSRSIAARDLATRPGSATVETRRGAVRGLPLALAAGASGDLDVITCSGSTLRVAAADLDRYTLVENSRGLVKLVERATGRTHLRGVIELHPR